MKKSYASPDVIEYGSITALTGAYGISGATDQSDFPVGTLLPNGETVVGAGSIDVCFGTGSNDTSTNDGSC